MDVKNYENTISATLEDCKFVDYMKIDNNEKRNVQTMDWIVY